MVILRIEHTVPDFEDWKKGGFDSDPLDRKASGVVRYRIAQPIDDPKYAVIELEFNKLDEAEAMLERLKVMWGNVMDRFGWTEKPKTQILNMAASKEY
jgi:hypothetical protein